MHVQPSESQSRASAPESAVTNDWPSDPSRHSRPLRSPGEPGGSSSGTGGTTPRPTSRRIGIPRLSAILLGLALVAAYGVREIGVLKGLSSAAAPRAASIGHALEAGIERMDALLLRLQLTGDSAYRDTFLEESQAWTARLGDARAAAATDGDRQARLQPAATALAEYIAATREIVSRARPSLRRDTAAQLAADIDKASTPLRAASAALVAFEASTEDARQAQVAATLAALPRRLAIVALVLLVIAVGAAALVWRGIIAPLQSALRELPSTHQHRDRLAQLGTVAAGVVHEIRTPLTAIRTRAHQLRRSALDGHPDLTVIEDEVRRLDRILEDFLQFARPSQPRREDVNLPALLNGIQDLVRIPLSERGISVHLENPADLVVDADPAHLRQVLLNLVRNAADSLASGGVVTLRARVGMDTRSKPAAPVVMIEVADTGNGIAPEVESRLFEPFVTAKPQGTGLGLSIAARLVEAHGGHIQYQTQFGRGTVFTVVLPRTAPPPAPGVTQSA